MQHLRSGTRSSSTLRLIPPTCTRGGSMWMVRRKLWRNSEGGALEAGLPDVVSRELPPLNDHFKPNDERKVMLKES